MIKIIHYQKQSELICSKSIITLGHAYCGVKNAKTTHNEKKVTCNNCLKRLFINQNTVVDEQKREFAQSIWSNAIQKATHSYCVFCQSGLHSDNGIVHDESCIVLSAQKYLKNLEA